MCYKSYYKMNGTGTVLILTVGCRFCRMEILSHQHYRFRVSSYVRTVPVPTGRCSVIGQDNGRREWGHGITSG